MKRRLLPALTVVAAAVAAAVALYRWNPATTGFYPPCLFHEWTGLHCAGCGSLRAFHALLHGDVARALSLNPLVTLSVPVLALGLAREAIRWTRGSDPIGYRLPPWTIWTFVAVLVVFAVARNLPGFECLAP